jgi:hypothetical protein
MQEPGEITSELCKLFEALWGRLHDLALSLKYGAAVLLRKNPNRFANPPPGRSHELQAIHSRNQHCDALIPNHSDALRETLKRLQLKTGHVEFLELFGGIGHEKRVLAQVDAERLKTEA